MVLAAACFRAPENGSLSADNSLGSTRSFLGISTAGSTGGVQRSAQVQFLRDPSLSPLVDSNWGNFSTRFPLGSNALTGHGLTFFVWSADASLASQGVGATAWPPGGAIAFRALAPLLQGDGSVSGDRQLPAFDDDAAACLASFPTDAPWPLLADKCVSKYPGSVSRMLDTSHNPALPVDATVATKQPRFLSFKKDRLAGLIQADSTPLNYYQRVGDARLPPTLAQFKTTYGFTGNLDNSFKATYYNYGDLGLGREMTCRTFAKPNQVQAGVACYVTNFAGAEFGKPFGAYADNETQRTRAFDDAIAHTTNPSAGRDVATVAMAWDPDFPNEPVIFAAYNGTNPTPGTSGSAFAARKDLPSGARLDKAVLDNEARLDINHGNATIPSNCLNCHGGSSTLEGTGASQKIKGAMFLPFDLENLRFKSSGSFSRPSQEQQFTALNALVLTTVLPGSPTANPVIADTITRWYNGNVLAGIFDDTFVPEGWKSANSGQPWSDKFYSSVVQPYCQGCHITQQGKDFTSFASFSPLASTALGLACGPRPSTGTTSVASTHLMPHAEMTMKHFWESPARAHLLSAFGSVPFASGQTPSFANGCGSTEPNVAIR